MDSSATVRLIGDVVRPSGGSTAVVVGARYRDLLSLVAGLVSYAVPGSPLDGVPVTVFSDRVDADDYWGHHGIERVRRVDHLCAWVGVACSRTDLGSSRGVILVDSVASHGSFNVWNAVHNAKQGRYSVVVGVPDANTLGGETLLRVDSCLFRGPTLLDSLATTDRLVSVMGSRSSPRSVLRKVGEHGVVRWLALWRNVDDNVFMVR